MEFPSRDEVKLWIYHNQLGRRNLDEWQRYDIAKGLESIEKEKARQRQGTRTDITPKLAESEKGDTRDKIAKMVGVSHGKLKQMETIEQQAPETLKQQVRSGEISINQAYLSVKDKDQRRNEMTATNKPHVANNSNDNEWYTPSEYIESARSVMGSIDLDPASNDFANETVKAETYYSKEDDGTKREWFGNIWLNPPYETALIQAFADKLKNSDFKQAIILVNNATETKWFATLITKASAVVFPTGRIKYNKRDGRHGTPLQGQAFLYFGRNTEGFLNVFKKYGWGAIL